MTSSSHNVYFFQNKSPTKKAGAICGNRKYSMIHPHEFFNVLKIEFQSNVVRMTQSGPFHGGNHEHHCSHDMWEMMWYASKQEDCHLV